MSASRETIVIVTFENSAQPATARRLRELLDIPDAPENRMRWHCPQLVTVRVDGVDNELLDRIRVLPGVRKVFHLPPARWLYTREQGSPRVTVEVNGGVQFGEGHLTVIAGPCSVESREQIIESAEIVAEAGAKALRGGVFKPRTSPYQFGGLGELGLEYLAAARERTGLPIVTEALALDQVETVAKWADVIHIGSRNMQNFPLLFEAGANSRGCPVMLKRGLAATVEEFLLATEYVLLGRLATDHLEPGLILCERGIRTFSPALRFTLDVGAIPILKELTPYPIIGDPSHAAGERRLVGALGRAAIAVGADGLIVEVHRDPDCAWCDASQSLDAKLFRELMSDLRKYSVSEVPVG